MMLTLCVLGSRKSWRMSMQNAWIQARTPSGRVRLMWTRSGLSPSRTNPMVAHAEMCERRPRLEYLPVRKSLAPLRQSSFSLRPV
eukprot:2816738-Rhodomonas_salina.1